MARARSNTSANSSAQLGIEAKLWLAASLRADYVLANPPFNDSDWFRKDDDPALRDWQFGVPPRGNANFAWVQHFIHHLAPHGMAGFVLANGSRPVRRLPCAKRKIQNEGG